MVMMVTSVEVTIIPGADGGSAPGCVHGYRRYAMHIG